MTHPIPETLDEALRTRFADRRENPWETTVAKYGVDTLAVVICGSVVTCVLAAWAADVQRLPLHLPFTIVAMGASALLLFGGLLCIAYVVECYREQRAEQFEKVIGAIPELDELITIANDVPIAVRGDFDEAYRQIVAAHTGQQETASEQVSGQTSTV